MQELGIQPGARVMETLGQGLCAPPRAPGLSQLGRGDRTGLRTPHPRAGAAIAHLEAGAWSHQRLLQKQHRLGAAVLLPGNAAGLFLNPAGGVAPGLTRRRDGAAGGTCPGSPQPGHFLALGPRVGSSAWSLMTPGPVAFNFTPGVSLLAEPWLRSRWVLACCWLWCAQPRGAVLASGMCYPRAAPRPCVKSPKISVGGGGWLLSPR